MQELVPVVIGIAIGVVVGPRRTRWTAVALVAASCVAGVLIAWILGELARSVGYAVIDSAVALCTAVLVVGARGLAAGITGRTSAEEVRRG